VPKAEAEHRIRQWLRVHAAADPESVTVDDVVAGTGVSRGAVSQSGPWQAFEGERKKRRAGGERAIPLDKVLLGRPDDSQDTPFEIASRHEDEEDWTEILQRVESPAERDRLNALPDKDRQLLLESYRESRRGAAAEGSRPVRRERSRRS
jgi:hypothetical protein